MSVVAKEEPLLFVMLAQFYYQGKMSKEVFEQAMHSVKLARQIVNHEIMHETIRVTKNKK